MASISFASESLMDPRIQVKLDKYQKCGNIISQTSLLSSYTGSETDADSVSRYSESTIYIYIFDMRTRVGYVVLQVWNGIRSHCFLSYSFVSGRVTYMYLGCSC